jgi:phage major head subunit gpT-like protein
MRQSIFLNDHLKVGQSMVRFPQDIALIKHLCVGLGSWRMMQPMSVSICRTQTTLSLRLVKTLHCYQAQAVSAMRILTKEGQRYLEVHCPSFFISPTTLLLQAAKKTAMRMNFGFGNRQSHRSCGVTS